MGTTTPAIGLFVDPEALALLATKCLEEDGSENTNNYTYVVSVTWLNTWKKYTGQIKPFHPGVVKTPGPVEQDIKNLEDNDYVDGKLWRHLIYWYGLHPAHELDRLPKNDWTSPTDFSIGMMSQLSDQVKRKIKNLNTRESVGYIECQVRQIFGVPKHRETRMWIKKEGKDCGGYQLLCDRFKQFCTAAEELGTYICNEGKNLLNLEICNPHGDWPTGYVTQVSGKLNLLFGDVTVGGQISSVQHDNLVCENKEHQLHEMQEHLQAQAAIYHKLGATHDQEQRRLAQELNLVFEEKKKQNDHEKNLKYKERLIQDRESALQAKIEKFHKERADYENEHNRAEQLNAITDNQITLNVGGKHFMTSLQTLRNIEDTFFASMFSGRYPLNKSPDGSYFIDRDGTLFYYILEYLRNGQIDIQSFIKNDDTVTLKSLFVEADYYNLNGLYNDIRTELHLDYEDLFDAFKNLATLHDDLFDEL